MIPVVTGFSGMQLLSSNYVPSVPPLTGVKHPLGKCIYLKALPHWAINGLRGVVRAVNFLTNPQIIVPNDEQAFTGTIVNGDMDFSVNAGRSTDDKLQYHCGHVARLPEWEELSRKFPYGEVRPAEATTLIPELQSQFDLNSPTRFMPDILYNNLNALVKATVEEREQLLITLMKSSSTYYLAKSTMFIALDENHWFPLILNVTTDGVGHSFQYSRAAYPS